MALADWQNRQEIQVPASKIGSNLTTFPLFIPLKGHNIFDILNDISLRKKMALFDSTGAELFIEHGMFWDPQNRNGVIVARADLSSTIDNDYILAYDETQPDNPNVKDPGEAPGNLFGWAGNGYKGAWLMGQTPSITPLVDSVGTYTGTAWGGMAPDDIIDGIVGKAIEFDGFDDYYSTGGVNPFLVGGATWITMIKPGGNFPGGRVMGRSLNAPNLGFELVSSSLKSAEIGVSPDGSAWYWTRSADDTLLDDEWTMMAFVWNGTNIKCYMNGVEEISGGFPLAFSAAQINTSGQNLWLASNQQFPDTFGGQIQYMALLDVAKNADWMYAEYLNQIGGLVEFGDFTNGKFIRQTSFRCRLTGFQDGVEDVTIPCTNFQATRYDGGQTSLTCTIPDADTHSGIFTARPNGELLIDAIYNYSDGTTGQFEVVRVPLGQVPAVYGGLGTSIQANGTLTEEYLGGGTKTLPGINTLNVTPAGNRSIRMNALLPGVKPGDTVEYQNTVGGTESLVVKRISMSVSGSKQSFTMTE